MNFLIKKFKRKATLTVSWLSIKVEQKEKKCEKIENKSKIMERMFGAESYHTNVRLIRWQLSELVSYAIDNNKEIKNKKNFAIIIKHQQKVEIQMTLSN